jgi:hypothetical protein
MLLCTQYNKEQAKVPVVCATFYIPTSALAVKVDTTQIIERRIVEKVTCGKIESRRGEHNESVEASTWVVGGRAEERPSTTPSDHARG